MANSAITISSLSFDTIKNNLKTFLRGQSKFSDYDFDGSNMSVLIDLLAFNAYNQGFYLNMIGNEMFLDSAQLRENVVARARELGYLPTSMQGAESTLQLQVTPTNTSVDFVTVPKNTTFTSTVENQTLNYVVDESVVIDKNANGDFIHNITIVEGTPLTHRFLVTSSNTTFTIPNDNIDTRSLIVDVQASNTDTTSTRYNKSTTIVDKVANSKIFFLEEGSDSKYNISFGDNIIGQKPVTGNVVKVDYRICNGTLGNGANTFSLSGSTIDGHSNVSFTVLTSARNGVNRESIDSIKFNAPRSFTAQDRVVGERDYKTFITSNYTDIQAVNVWGGEENDPPKYGQVLISAKPLVNDTLTNTRKNEIIKALKEKNIVTITPEFVDPEILYIELDCIVNFDPTLTTLSSNQVKNKVLSAITNYASVNLLDFGDKFRYSKLTSSINDADNSILSTEVTMRIQKRIKPIIGTAQKYTIQFQNEFREQDPDHATHAGHIPTVFTDTSYLIGDTTTFFQDDGNGHLYSYRLNSGGNQVIINNNIGDVDYVNGIVTLNDFNPASITTGSIIKVVAKPKRQDIVGGQNTIIEIDLADVSVTMVEDE